jgi:23S rRNA (cytosine1962-C5)-methyltransferase
MGRATEHTVRLRKPLERSVLSGHPWLYREALEPFEAVPGSVIRVLDKSGRHLARGLAEAGPIAVRVFTTRDEAVDEALYARRFADAFALRSRFVPSETNAYRLLHGEGDRLPGIVCDRYDRFAVLKLDGEAALAWETRLTEWLREPLSALGVTSLLVRSGRTTDTLPTPASPGRPVRLAWGEDPKDTLVVQEHRMRLCVSLLHGQKTGLFLDHRESRRRIRELTRDLTVLNLYGYTGGFSVAAGLGGARMVTTVDSAAPALLYAERSWTENGLDPTRHTSATRDVAELLAEFTAERRLFDLVVADPPNFAPNAASKNGALDSYAALHRSVLNVLHPGGYYLAASCSSHVTRDDFEATLREGARRARRIVQVLERWSAPADHPRLLAFPEGDYLKVTLLRAG